MPNSRSINVAIICCTLLLSSLLHAGTNPFEQVAQANYEGRYVGPNVTLQLKPEAGKWTGTVILRGNRYTLQGETRDGKLEGTFGAGDQTWPFSAKSDGENLNFTTGESTTPLTKVKLPKLEGLYESKQVKLEFLNQDGGINGTIAYNGKQFQFSAKETGGDVAGVFKSGEAAFPFKIVKEGSQIEFQTEGFAEAIKPPYDPEEYRAKAEQGDANAQLNMGRRYETGKDLVEAVKWYRKAAEQGNAAAQYEVARCYRYGKGIEKDMAEAMRWYRMSADQGYHFAQLILSSILATFPQPDIRNGKEAVELATKMCNANNMANKTCLDILAAAYAETGDYDQAVSYAKKAIDIAKLPADEKFIQGAKERLKLYEDHKPYRRPE